MPSKRTNKGRAAVSLFFLVHHVILRAPTRFAAYLVVNKNERLRTYFKEKVQGEYGERRKI